ncbi:type II toxin-antitoxin system RelE/ParE family toxin [Pelagicoccus sp. SDUM812005]|uniref:type II toxin-antitoxin system RelE/ParE family toxin n=1 Tax=Pelagicoccus sp. SDUM812005 TaxID=3041257 RepID=UPI00280E0AB5|nr:type II toxin-antitoxin system RelE/ParE family toxin [Pelagicoccus sp. SDUM812005]MDQ8183686.1 type II toxin-antitoxin system RelE/ParE family toxin [Pelagicoccus sp. SDUM812005]
MIRSFSDKATRELWENEKSRRFASVARVALRRLIQLNAAESLDDLRVPPGNHLESLSGDREGQHSMRVNRQYRICFSWTDEGPVNVEIVDYH